MTTENGQQSVIRGVLTTEVKYIVGLIVFTFGIAAPYFSIRENIALIQQDISTIEKNHLTTTQELAQEVKDVDDEQTEILKLIYDLQKEIILLKR